MKIASAFKTSLVALAGGVATIAAAGAASAQDMDRIAEADANGDGNVEWQEMLDMRAAIFERLDRNGDGFADSADNPRMGPGKRRYTEALDQLQNVDADSDGRISQTEMLDAPAPLFDAGDTDGDKVLSADEIDALRETAANR